MAEGLVKCPTCYRQFWIRNVPPTDYSRTVPPHSAGAGRCSGSSQTVPVVDRRNR
jgi:hypothetical protein